MREEERTASISENEVLVGGGSFSWCFETFPFSLCFLWVNIETQGAKTATGTVHVRALEDREIREAT